MVNRSKRHAIVQAHKAMSAISCVPDLKRTQHLLKTEVANADRFGRQVKELKPVATALRPRSGQTQEQAAESLSARLSAQALRNEKIRASLEHLHSVRGLDKPRVPAAHVVERLRSTGRR